MIVETSNLSKKYKKDFALKDCSIHVSEGDIYGIIGKNGAGKSTLLKLLCGVTEKTQGEIEIFGKKDLKNSRKKIGAIIENPLLFGSLSAKENLKYFAFQKGLFNDKEIRESLEKVGLEYTDKKPIKEYSLGMKQRLALGLCLMLKPELLILDEPVNGIDPEGIVEIRNLLLKLNREEGVTIIISSHILPELENLVTKIAIIDSGRLIEEMSLEEIHKIQKPYLELITSDNNKTMEILKKVYKIENVERLSKDLLVVRENISNIDQIVKTLVMENIGLYRVASSMDTLEDYYLKKLEPMKQIL